MARDKNNPCTTRVGNRKRRYPNVLAAWFVADLVARGLHADLPHPNPLHPYECPGCGGWHLTKCTSPADLERHQSGLAWMRDELKIPQNANVEEHGD